MLTKAAWSSPDTLIANGAEPGAEAVEEGKLVAVIADVIGPAAEAERTEKVSAESAESAGISEVDVESTIPAGAVGERDAAACATDPLPLFATPVLDCNIACSLLTFTIIKGT